MKFPFFGTMNTNTLFIVLLSLLFDTWALAQSFINNGTFEYGGPGLGFWIDGQGYNQLTEPYSGSTSAGNYAFVHNPNNLNTNTFLSIGDHTSGQGLMMVVDGNTIGGQQRFWKAGDNGGGICNLNVGETYYFSYWIHSVTNAVSGSNELADIGVYFNNASNVNLVFGTTLAPLPNFGWKKVSYSFTPTSSCVNIELYNNNTNFIGNDFAIDDIKLNAVPGPLSFAYSITEENCSEENSGLLVIYPDGGTTPYTFELVGPDSSSAINETGIFSDLAQGFYTLVVTDDEGDQDSLENLQISSISTLETSVVDTAICPGDVLEIVAFGGNGNYQWASSNPFEVGFPNTQDTISVVPLIETTFTVESEVDSVNLIFNGDFENGNEGFASQYAFVLGNSQGQQRTYSVRSNPSNMFVDFEPCIDHTSGNGTGKMMVVDGSTYNIGNDAFWCQLVAVEPNKNYSLSYWATSLSPSNIAQIRVEINGVTIGSNSVPSQNCSWGQILYSWNSGSDSLAQICFYDSNFEAVGNDFAIDDIALRSSNTCQSEVLVAIATNNPFYDVYFPETICSNQENILPELGPSHVSGGVFSSTPSGLNIDPFTGEIQTSNSNAGEYIVSYTAEVCGVFVPDSFLVSMQSPPQVMEVSGGQYNCVLHQFDSLYVFANGDAPFQLFYSINGTSITANSMENTFSIGNTPGTYQIDSIQDNSCRSSLDISIMIDPQNEPIQPLISGDTAYCINAIANPLQVQNEVGEISWYSDEGLTELIGLGSSLIPSTTSSSQLYITQTVGGCEGLASEFNVSVEPCGFIIPTAFTPNMDGDNDIWNLQDIDLNYPENSVRVYNRWGELLYESIPGNYSNKPWDGKHNESLLPSGSYFYIIELNVDEATSLNGIVTILSDRVE